MTKKMTKIFFAITIIIILCPNLALAGCTGASSGSSVEICDPLGNTSPEVLIGNVINAVMGVVGSLALAMFIYGGFTWMLAAGNDQRVQKGKDILLWATIGLIVIFSSYALVRLVFTGIGLT